MGTEVEAKDSQRKEDIGSSAFSPELNGAGDVTGLISERIENLVQAIDEIDTALIQRKALNEKFLEQSISVNELEKEFNSGTKDLSWWVSEISIKTKGFISSFPLRIARKVTRKNA